MAYFTGAYKKFIPFRHSCIWSWNGFEVMESYDGRLHLIRNGYELSVLPQGMYSLKKNYKDSFIFWIESVKLKDEKKVEGIREKIFFLENDINLIESIWK